MSTALYPAVELIDLELLPPQSVEDLHKSFSTTDSETFMYLSPASSVSIPPQGLQSVCDSIEDTIVNGPVTLEEVESYLHDDVVRALWQRLIQVRYKIADVQVKPNL
jgi:hypothetical protein